MIVRASTLFAILFLGLVAVGSGEVPNDKVGKALQPSTTKVSAAKGKTELVATTKPVGSVSIVIMNWSRRDRVKAALPRYNSMSIVHEIIVSHGKRDTKFTTPELPKVKHFDHWDLNASKGLLRRYISAMEAERDCILYIDDDMVIPESAVEILYSHWVNNKDSVHGYTSGGRSISREGNGHLRYNVLENAPEGEYPIVVTQFAMTSKRITKFALDQAQNFEQLQHEINPKPLWNGEDILLSLSAIHLNTRDGKSDSKRSNWIWLCPGVFEDRQGDGISIQWRDHVSFRSVFTEALVDYFTKEGTSFVRWIR